MTKLKKGSWKYKGKLTLKCFNYGNLRHFVVKCPYARNESSDGEEDHSIKERKSYDQKKNYKKDEHEKKKNFYQSKEKSILQRGY